MKTIKFLLIFLILTVICSSCQKKPQSIAFITNMTNASITLYSERDSIFLSPLQRTYMADIDVKNGKIVFCSGLNWTFSINPLTKIRVLDSIYTMPEQYQSILLDLTNYQHTMSTGSNGFGSKYVGDYYDFYLRIELVEQIINESNVNHN